MPIAEIKKVCFVGAGTMGCYNSLITALAGTVIWSTFLIIYIPSLVLMINIYPAEKTENGITLIPGAGILRGINLMSLKPDFTSSRDGIRTAAIQLENHWNH